jgi:transcriptional regulator with XRE-family HTH domain
MRPHTVIAMPETKEYGVETQFGFQPIREVLFTRRIYQTTVAKDLGVTFGHLRRAVTGRCRPNNTLRKKLPEYLGVPLTDLFTADSLAKPYVEGRGVKK